MKSPLFHTIAAMVLALVLYTLATSPVLTLSALGNSPVEVVIDESTAQNPWLTRLDGSGVKVGPDHTRQAEAGQTVVYHHTLTNTGTLTDTFLLEVFSTQHWPTTLLGEAYPTGTLALPIHVGAHMTASFQVSLSVPLGVRGVAEITFITATSQLSPTVRDVAIDTTIVPSKIYLPLSLKQWPLPLPNPPALDPIDNAAGNGSYRLNWTEQPLRWANTYEMQEAADATFSADVREACRTTNQTCGVNGRAIGTYYYRVRGHNPVGYSAWSNAQAVTVTNPITMQTSAIYDQGYAIRVGDLNHDGLNDVAFTTYSDRLRIWIQNPLCHELQEQFDLLTAPEPIDLAISDLNADGYADIVVVGQGLYGMGNPLPGVVSILFQTSSGLSTSPVTYTVGSNPLRVRIGDISSDGRPDIVVSSRHNLDGLIQQPNGIFSSIVITNPPVSTDYATPPYDIAIDDFNNDERAIFHA